jgi:small-conductance mechanosensitive channel
MKQVTLVFGALGVGIGFGLQTVANNFVSGIILLAEHSIQAGDIVELENGTMGEVVKINIRSTVIRTYDGLDIIVPNSDLVSGKVTSWTYEDDWRRLKIPFGIAYGSDPQQAAQIAKKRPKTSAALWKTPIILSRCGSTDSGTRL